MCTVSYYLQLLNELTICSPSSHLIFHENIEYQVFEICTSFFSNLSLMCNINARARYERRWNVQSKVTYLQGSFLLLNFVHEN